MDPVTRAVLRLYRSSAFWKAHLARWKAHLARYWAFWLCLALAEGFILAADISGSLWLALLALPPGAVVCWKAFIGIKRL